jgi:cytochrome c oxidase assembly factor CtaG
MIALLHPGGPPHPHELWRAWHADPLVVGPLLLAGFAYALGLRRLWRAGHGRGIPQWRARCFALGMAALVAALLSPIDALGEALFSAHMVQHLLLLVVAPPLLVLGAAGYAFVWALPWRARRGWSHVWHQRSPLRRAVRPLHHPLVAWVLQAIALTVWHVPMLYDAAVRLAWVHALEHASFLGAALLFWSSVLEPAPRLRPAFGAGLLGVFAAAMQGGALGALLTFGEQPWYAAHRETVAEWSLTAVQDQQIAGAIMWVPGGMAYVLALAVLMSLWLRAAERRVRAAEAAHAAGDGRPEDRNLGLELS